jgi:transposase
MRKSAFKEYPQHQLQLLPPSFDDLIGQGHMVRVVNEVIDQIDWQVFAKAFVNKGQPPYHPRMMMKLIVYAYSTKNYSSRKIEKALLQDITYMWLSGGQKPEHNTINRFRSEYFKGILNEVFTQVLDFLHNHGYVKFENYFVDGTKLKANASRSSYVWKKNVERYKEQLQKNVKSLLLEIDEINRQEDEQYGQSSLEELHGSKPVDSAGLKQLTQQLNEKLSPKSNPVQKKRLGAKIHELTKKAEKLEGYEKQEQILGERNSFSKSDPDASFFKDEKYR